MFFLLPMIVVLLCGRAAGVLWSTLGVVDDGRTDNTAALNALPPATFIIGDCPHGGVVLAQGTWNLQSNLFVQLDAGCEILSNATGTGSYAVSQLRAFFPHPNFNFWAKISKSFFRHGRSFFPHLKFQPKFSF